MKTPCYIINKYELERSFDGFNSAMRSYFKHYIPSYSVKTNSLPYVLKTALAKGYFAEVVSDDEYALALGCGFKRNQIVFNGPMKSKETFLDAVEGGAMVNIETFREIEWLKCLPQNQRYGVGLRMNINISSISPADQNHVDDNSRFGFSCESDDFDKAVAMINALPNVDFCRLHIHRTSRTRSIAFYCNLIDYAMTQLAKRNLTIDQIDFGGGYYGIMPYKPTYNEYANAISKALAKHRPLSGITAIIEPGNAIVASAFSFEASVIDVKQHDGACYVTIDGSRIDVDPFFHKNSFFKEIIPINDEESAVVSKQIIGGCTCLEYDRLMELENERLLQPGDHIRFNRVGAYTMTLTPLFIRYWPCVYVDDGQKLTCVREKFSAEKLIY